MICKNPKCFNPHKGQRYVVDGVEICLSCAEMNRAGRMLNLDDFMRLPPHWQKMIGDVRVMIQEVIGEFDRYKNDGVQLLRG